jgi:hypothetical protein
MSDADTRLQEIEAKLALLDQAVRSLTPIDSHQSDMARLHTAIEEVRAQTAALQESADKSQGRLDAIEPEWSTLKAKADKASRVSTEVALDMDGISRKIWGAAAAAAAVGVVAIVLLVLGIPKRGVIPGADQIFRTQRIELVDENGKPRIVLDALKDGVTSIVLQDAAGHKRGAILVKENEVTFGCYHAEGKDGIVLNLDKEGQAGLNLCDSLGRPRVGMIVRKLGPQVVLTDERGNKLWGGP